MKILKQKIGLLAVTAVMSILVVGCSVPPEGENIYAEDMNVFPDRGFSDWITYADQISVVEVVSQRRMKPEKGFGLTSIGRVLALKVIENIWTKDGTAFETVDIVANGWIVKGGKLRPVVTVHGERMQVGQRYLMPLVNSSGEWGKLAATAVIPIQGNTVTYSNADRQEVGATRRYANMSVASIANAVSTTNPDPLSWQVDQALGPVQRAIAISDLRDHISGDAERAERDGENR